MTTQDLHPVGRTRGVDGASRRSSARPLPPPPRSRPRPRLPSAPSPRRCCCSTASRSSSVQMAPVAPQPMPAGRLDADVSGRFRLDVHLAQVIAAVNTPNLRDRAPDTLNASSRRRRYLTTRSSLKRRRKANTVSPSCSDAMFSKRAVSSGCSTGGPTSLYASCRRPSPMVPFDRIESSRRTVWPLSSWWSLMTARRWSGACRRAGSSAARRRA